MSTIDTTSALGSLLHEHRDQILEIAARHHARNVRVFGSVARGQATAASDIDFLVDFDKDSSLFDVLHLADELKTLLGREVDVVSTGGLKQRDDRIRAEAVDL
jgi:predicted nucleotidyltransferase